MEFKEEVGLLNPQTGTEHKQITLGFDGGQLYEFIPAWVTMTPTTPALIVTVAKMVCEHYRLDSEKMVNPRLVEVDSSPPIFVFEYLDTFDGALKDMLLNGGRRLMSMQTLMNSMLLAKNFFNT